MRITSSGRCRLDCMQSARLCCKNLSEAALPLVRRCVNGRVKQLSDHRRLRKPITSLSPLSLPVPYYRHDFATL